MTCRKDGTITNYPRVNADWKKILPGIEAGIQEGATVQHLARAAHVSADGAYWALRYRGRRVAEFRSGLFQVRSLTQVAQLFGVSETAARTWVTHGWLKVSRNAIKVRARYRSLRFHISDANLVDFLSVREAWPLWKPRWMTDPDWRDAAQELRDRAGGKWMTTAEVAELLHWDQQTIGGWIRSGNWPVEWIDIGRRWFVWAPDSGLPPRPSNNQGKRGNVSAARAVNKAGAPRRQGQASAGEVSGARADAATA